MSGVCTVRQSKGFSNMFTMNVLNHSSCLCCQLILPPPANTLDSYLTAKRKTMVLEGGKGYWPGGLKGLEMEMRILENRFCSFCIWLSTFGWGTISSFSYLLVFWLVVLVFPQIKRLGCAMQQCFNILLIEWSWWCATKKFSCLFTEFVHALCQFHTLCTCIPLGMSEREREREKALLRFRDKGTILFYFIFFR